MTIRADLGLSCPSRGKFYVCENASIRFIGCCTVDPCADGSGVCPENDLAPASFSSDHYNSIPAQSCASPSNSTRWFTCRSSQPFMGCCGINPCENDGCPAADLLSATLSDDANNAQVFLSSSSSSPSPSPSPTPSSNTDSSSSSGYSLPLGAILGIALGGAAVVAILLAIIAYRYGWLARNRKDKKDAEEPTNYYSPQGPYSPGMTQWQDGHYSSPQSPAFATPGFAAYSPNQQYQNLQQPQSPPQSAESLHRDNRHASQMSGMSGWNSITTDSKHQSYSPLLGPPATELEGRDTERPIIAELPSSPIHR